MKFKDWLKIREDAGMVHGTYANDGPFAEKLRSNRVASGDFSPPKNNLPPATEDELDKKTSKKRKNKNKKGKTNGLF